MKRIDEEVDEIQDVLMTENFNENDCKNELGNNLSEAAKTVILNASKFQDDFVDSDVVGKMAPKMMLLMKKIKQR